MNQPLKPEEGQIFEVRMKASEAKEDQVDQLSQDQDDLSEKSEKVVSYLFFIS